MPAADEDIRIEVVGSLARVTLDRPKALNAMTRGMRARLFEALPKFARDPQVYAVVQCSRSPRAFCAGADVREVIALAKSDMAEARNAFREEYALNWQVECFSKPTVALVNGMVMGGGVGISQFGTHRVAGEGYKWAMPETMIGLFPDVGQAHVLARMPDAIGLYLGLTGRSIGSADAYALGLVTHCIPSTRFGEIEAGLIDTWPVDTLLDDRHEYPGRAPLAEHRETIARCFDAGTVEEITARLSEVRGGEADWAREAVSDLNARSPTSLKVTLRHIRAARALDIRETLRADYRLACRFLRGHDFHEGARAVLIEKDGKPRWAPSRIEDVTAALVDDYFTPPSAEEDLTLPTRQEMQAARA